MKLTEQLALSIEPKFKKDPLFKGQQTKARIMKANNSLKLGRNPYPNSKNLIPNIKMSYLVDLFYDIYNDSDSHYPKDKALKVKGRLTLHRKMGKIAFGTIKDNGKSIQYVIQKENVDNMSLLNSVDVGDILLIEGTTYVTEKGENSLMVSNLFVCSKSLAEPVGKFAGLEDEEIKTRKRYLDMVHSDDLVNTLKKRSLIVSAIRRFFENHDFLEVETPTLHRIQGGANAKPFKTHYNALGEDRFLRVAPELYLKKLLVGGMDKVFEIGKNFRNEGIDSTHNPEFTSIEFYESFATYEDHINLIQELFNVLTKKLEIDRITLKRSTFEEILGLFSPYDDLRNESKLRSSLERDGFRVQGKDLGQLWELIFDEFVEEELHDGLFITDYPKSISPLARAKDDDDFLCERFELFVGGKEIANGFNELSNPLEQHKRFQEQMELKDDESMPMDESFIDALMVGLPPCAGVGIGIDRLVMQLLGKTRIKDVIAFPEYKG